MVLIPENHNLILNSSYNFNYELPKCQNIPEYFFHRVQQNISNGIDAGIMNPISGEETLYKDFNVLSNNVASYLYKLGFRKGDTLIYSSHNAAKLHVFLLGVWKANGIVRASYPEDTKDSLLGRIIESQAKWILTDLSIANDTIMISKKANWDVNVITFGEEDGCLPAEDFFMDNGDSCPNLEVGPNDKALILATSGTTGASKGAFYTHERLLTHLVYNEHVPSTDDPKAPFLFLGKQTHLSGCVAVLSFIVAGRQLLMMSKYSVHDIFESIHKYRPKGIFAFPTFLLALVNHPDAHKYDFSSIMFAQAGGAVVGPSLIESFQKLPNVKALIVLYGLTECGMLTTNGDFVGESSGSIRAFPNIPSFTVGKLLPSVSLAVVNLESGELLGPGEKGELYFKTRQMFNGYLNKEKETNEVLQNGWLRTGDMGYYDSDGFVYVLERVKEIFKYYNNHISPSEIEDVLLRHLNVANACVIGVPDPEGGDTIPKAFVVLKNNNVETLNEIKNFAHEHLESYKHLRGGIIALSNLPSGKTGKITRMDLAKHIEDLKMVQTDPA